MSRAHKRTVTVHNPVTGRDAEMDLDNTEAAHKTLRDLVEPPEKFLWRKFLGLFSSEASPRAESKNAGRTEVDATR